MPAPDLLLDVASGRAVTGLCRCLRRCRRSSEKQEGADGSADEMVLEMHIGLLLGVNSLDRGPSGRESPEEGTHSETEAERSASQLRLVADPAPVRGTP